MLYNLGMNKKPEKTVEKWKVRTSEEVLVDKDLISYYRLHQQDEVYEFKLLGQFNEDGKYELPEDLRRTLVQINKQLSEKMADTLVAYSHLEFLALTFKVKLWQSAGQCVANLYFIEHLDEGEEIVSFVAQYIGEYDDTFVQKIKKAFNILDEVDDYSAEHVEKIKVIIEENERRCKEREFVVELQSEYYVLEMMEELKKGGEKSKRILEKLTKKHEEAKAKPSKGKMYTTLRRQLDKMIIKEGGFNELQKELPTFKKETLIFTKPVLEYDKITKQLEAMQMPKAEKKADKAKAKAKGGASKSSKGPKGNKPVQYKAGKDKKKEEEKKADDILQGGLKGDLKDTVDALKTLQKAIVTSATATAAPAPIEVTPTPAPAETPKPAAGEPVKSADPDSLIDSMPVEQVIVEPDSLAIGEPAVVVPENPDKVMESAMPTNTISGAPVPPVSKPKDPSWLMR